MPDQQERREEDGWYRVRGGDWRDWEFVIESDAEAEILAGGGADLMHLTFGYADGVLGQSAARAERGWPTGTMALAATLTELHQRFAQNLPAGWKLVPLEERDDDPGP